MPWAIFLSCGARMHCRTDEDPSLLFFFLVLFLLPSFAGYAQLHPLLTPLTRVLNTKARLNLKPTLTTFRHQNCVSSWLENQHRNSTWGRSTHDASFETKERRVLRVNERANRNKRAFTLHIVLRSNWTTRGKGAWKRRDRSQGICTKEMHQPYTFIHLFRSRTKQTDKCPRIRRRQGDPFRLHEINHM